MIMGYSGFKIPGHSETAQKNKKAFARRNHWGGKRPIDNQGEASKIVGKYKTQYGPDLSNWILALLFFLLAGASYWWHTAMTSDSPVERQVIETKRDGFSEEEQHAYNFLVSSGRKSLEIKDYRLATYEFNQALEIAPYGKQARLGLVATLKEMCAENAYYCKRVEEQQDFVKGMGWQEEE